MKITGHVAALLAAQAYRVGNESEADWEARITRNHADAQCHFAHSDCAHAYVLRHDREIVVAFRGTEPTNLRQWRADFRGLWARELTGCVHRGFQRSLQSIWFSLAGETRRMYRRGSRGRAGSMRLNLIGHSKGAGEATIAAAQFAIAGVKNVRLITFGSPRVGTAAFGASLIELIGFENIHRFVNNNDYVPRIVTQALLGFRHAGACKYFASDGTYHHDPSVVFRFFDGLTGRVENHFRRGADALADHYIRSYVRCAACAETRTTDLLSHPEKP